MEKAPDYGTLMDKHTIVSVIGGSDIAFDQATFDFKKKSARSDDVARKGP